MEESNTPAVPEAVPQAVLQLPEHEAKNPEMNTRITRLVLQGFKSFADRTELLFGEKFNVILGPNGSGKSNVFDAICFVLGKSSARSMRAEKSANLIYNGGTGKQPLKSAEVSIFFDNKTKNFPVPEEEVKITRIVNQEGQSKYKVGQRTVTRQEVLDLLGAAKINPDGYNIILQGDIQQFVLDTPLERRKIIEEIAGIGIYEEKKEKAVKELERVEERLREAEIILAEKNRRLKELKSDRDQALKYKDLSDKIKVNKASYLWMQIKKKKVEKENYDKLVMDEQQKIDALRAEIAELKKKNEEKKEEIRRIVRDIEEKGQKEQLELNKQVEDLKVKIGINKNKLEEHTKEIAKLDERKVHVKTQIEDAKKRISSLETSIADNSKKKSGMIKELNSIESKISDFRKKHSLDNQHEIDKEIEQIETESEKLQAEITKLREEQQSLMREKDKLELQIQGQDEKIVKVSEIEKENKGALDALRDKKSRFKYAALELSKLLSEDSTMAARLQSLRNKAHSMYEDKGKLEIRAASVREQFEGDAAVKEIMKNKSRLGEIYGTVSEIGKVDSQYALALKVAAGPRIKSIVVSDDSTAAKCIKYLRADRLGVASFIPLSKIKPKKDTIPENVLKADGVLGTAVELISFDSKFKKVFEYVFGDTLIVKNIDVARRIGVGTVRMATLEGDLIESTGAMVGGYRKQEGIGFQEKGLFEELDKATGEINAVEAEQQKVEKTRQELEKKIQGLREEKAALEGEIIKMERSMHLEGSDLEASKRQKELFREQEKDVDKKLDSVLSKISEMNSGLAKIKMKKMSLREKISELRSPAVLAELAAFEEKRKELAQSLADIDTDEKSIKMQNDSVAVPERERLIQLLKELDREYEKFKQSLGGAKSAAVEQEKELKVKEDRAKKFYEEFKESFEKRNKIQEEIAKNEEKVFRKEESSRQFEQEINKASIDMAEIKGAMAGLEEQFQQYQDVKIDESKTEDKLKKEIEDFEKIVGEIGTVNLRALEVYDEAEREYNVLNEKKDRLRKEKDDVLGMINEIDSRKKELFMQTFDRLNGFFMQFFQELSQKGEAFLEVENPDDPFLEGVNFKVRISGNKFLDIRGLSGGEKTLTSLAFLFAIQEFEPASFYVVDEVDAALDKYNSEKLAKLIRKYCANAQYIVVSHNEAIIREADILYGVNMNDSNISKVVGIKA